MKAIKSSKNIGSVDKSENTKPANNESYRYRVARVSSLYALMLSKWVNKICDRKRFVNNSFSCVCSFIPINNKILIFLPSWM